MTIRLIDSGLDPRPQNRNRNAAEAYKKKSYMQNMVEN